MDFIRNMWRLRWCLDFNFSTETTTMTRYSYAPRTTKTCNGCIPTCNDPRDRIQATSMILRWWSVVFANYTFWSLLNMTGKSLGIVTKNSILSYNRFFVHCLVMNLRSVILTFHYVYRLRLNLLHWAYTT